MARRAQAAQGVRSPARDLIHTAVHRETLRPNSGVMDGVLAQHSGAMGSVLPQLTGPEEKPVPGLMDEPRAGTRGASRIPVDQHDGEWVPNAGGKKKNYQRYPKPPYSYLAMIAMVIQNSPQKKLTLSQVRINTCRLKYFLHQLYSLSPGLAHLFIFPG